MPAHEAKEAGENIPAAPEQLDLMDAPAPEVDCGLLNVVPTPAPLDFEALEEEVSRHRRLIVRAGAVVSVSALVAIGGTIAFHSGIVGLFWLASTFMSAPHDGGGSPGQNGGEGPGYILTDDGNGAANGDIASPAISPVHQSKGITSEVPAKPPLTDPLPSPTEVAMNQLNDPSQEIPIIGIPAGESVLGTPRTSIRIPAAPSNMIVPPSQNDLPPGRGNAHGAGAVQGGSTSGVGDDDDVISWQKTPGGGKGKSGSGHGKTSGADRPEPVPWLTPDVPLRLTSKPKGDRIKYDVVVRADGTVASVKIAESSGEPDIDELYREQILKEWKYHAAYVGGKYREATASVTIWLVAK